MDKIENITIGQQVLENLRKKIMNVEFLPGELISLKGLAEMFGVSILPVREAVWQLEAEGILSVKPNKGIMINQLTKKEFKEIHLMRRALESMALFRACEVRNDKDVEKALQVLERMRKLIKKGDPRSYLQLNIIFHHVIYESADMPILLSTIQNLRMRVHPYIYQSVTTRRDVSQTLKVHEDIFDGFANQDAEFAVQALQTDLNEAAEVLLDNF